jgi:SWI/SNF-related matrix-associated actin-dependent regulator of chromatin subfamily A protein 2/4
MKALIDYIVEYEDNEGRRLSDPFMMLPPKKDLPDYYELIKRPVDIQKIRNRIRKENYRNLEDLESDVMLMCANTQQYNIDGSLIFEDSVILQSVFTSAKQMLQKSGQLPNATTIKRDHPESSNDGHSEVKKKKKKKKKKQSSDEDDDSDYSE